jgi:hypothetical protein
LRLPKVNILYRCSLRIIQGHEIILLLPPIVINLLDLILNLPRFAIDVLQVGEEVIIKLNKFFLDFFLRDELAVLAEVPLLLLEVESFHLLFVFDLLDEDLVVFHFEFEEVAEEFEFLELHMGLVVFYLADVFFNLSGSDDIQLTDKLILLFFQFLNFLRGFLNLVVQILHLLLVILDVIQRLHQLPF